MHITAKLINNLAVSKIFLLNFLAPTFLTWLSSSKLRNLVQLPVLVNMFFCLLENRGFEAWSLGPWSNVLPASQNRKAGKCYQCCISDVFRVIELRLIWFDLTALRNPDQQEWVLLSMKGWIEANTAAVWTAQTIWTKLVFVERVDFFKVMKSAFKQRCKKQRKISRMFAMNSLILRRSWGRWKAQGAMV